MPYTQEDLDTVNGAIKSLSTGQAVAEYEIRGRKVRYKDLSLNELQTLRRTIETEVLNSGSNRPRRRFSLITTGKGL